MYKIIDKRGTGKTTRLLLTAKETGATFVACGLSIDYVKDLAKKYDIKGVKIITLSEFLYHLVYKVKQNQEHETKFVFDEIETLARALNIVGYTDTLE